MRSATSPYYRPRRIAMTPFAFSCVIATTFATAWPALAQSTSTERQLTDTGEWTITEQPTIGTPERELAQARQALADERYEQAQRLADQWIERYPTHDLLPEALLVRGDSLLLQREYYKSLFDYEKIAREHYDSEAYAIALEREFHVATVFASGVKRKLWGIRWANADDEAEYLFIVLQERAPGSKLAENAGRALADFYFKRREMDLASTAYDIYIRNNIDAADRAEAMKRLVYSHLATFRGPAFDPAGLYDARAWLDRIQASYPAEAQLMGAAALQRRIDESDAEQILELARWYLSDEDPVSARFTLRRLLRKYPDSVAAGAGYDIMREHGWIREAPVARPSDVQAAEAAVEAAATAGPESEGVARPGDAAAVGTENGDENEQ